ncbi:MAG TPA: TIGR03915 family putative DNA repair protein [Clostridia bacterium]|nr:TIGR03915 family putative DNA repair protein [Clostridia bacterium]
MIIYICDSTFEGLMTAIYFAYKEKAECKVVSGETYQMSIGDTTVHVETDLQIFSQMENYIAGTCGIENLMTMYRAYLGELPDISNQIFAFFKVAIKNKLNTQYMHADPRVFPVLAAEKTTARESHKMLGFIRFKKIADDMLYAPYQPTSNVTPLVAKHFADRMNSYRWIIHDTVRGVYAVYNGEKCMVGCRAPDNLPILVDIDRDYEELWTSYTKSVAIEERRNLRLQMSFMPKKYWKFITEMHN